MGSLSPFHNRLGSSPSWDLCSISLPHGGEQRSRARPAVFVLVLSSCSATSLTVARRAVALLQASKDLEIINQVLKVKATHWPLFSIPRHSRQDGRLPGKCDALQAPRPRQVETFWLSSDFSEFMAARGVRLWSRSSDSLS